MVLSNKDNSLSSPYTFPPNNESIMREANGMTSGGD